MKKLILLFFILTQLSSFGQIDSLEKIVSGNFPDTSKLAALTELSWNYMVSDLTKSKAAAQKELVLAEKINSKKYIAQAYNDLGIVLIRESKFKESLTYHQKALEIRLPLGNEMDIASSYSKIGYCYSEMADFVKSLGASLKALDIYVKKKNKPYESRTLNNICNVYDNLRNYDKLIEFANRSYAISEELGDKHSKAAALNYIAAAYHKKKDFIKALEYGNKSLALFREVGDSSGICAELNNVGFYLRYLSKDKEALAYYTEALLIAERTGDLNSQALYDHNVGNIYLTFKNYQLAEQYYRKAEKLADQQNLSDIKMLVYKSIGEVCLKTNKNAEAEKYYAMAMSLQDSIFSKETAKQVYEMQTKYETKEKEEENIILQQDNELKNEVIRRGNIQKLFLFFGIILVALVSFLLYNRYKLKQKAVLNAEMMKQQELRSKAVLEAEEKERTRIARELHDGIGQQLSAARLNIAGLQNVLKTNNKEEKTLLLNAIELLDDSVKEVRTVSHSMMPNALIKSGLVSAVREFIHRISSTGNLKVNLEIVGLNERLEQTTETVLFRVLQELVNNIIKHAGANQISIQLVKHETELNIMVEDNGKGFDVAKILNEAAGIGLKNIQSRIAFLNGNVYFDSFTGKGTTVTIELPV